MLLHCDIKNILAEATAYTLGEKLGGHLPLYQCCNGVCYVWCLTPTPAPPYTSKHLKESLVYMKLMSVCCQYYLGTHWFPNLLAVSSWKIPGITSCTSCSITAAFTSTSTRFTITTSHRSVWLPSMHTGQRQWVGG